MNEIPRVNKECFLCGKLVHVVSSCQNGETLVHYASCRKFPESTPSQRSKLLFEWRLCQQCLVPDLRFEHQGSCSKESNCKNVSHGRFRTVDHFLVYGKYIELNSDSLTQYKKEFLPIILRTLI